MGEATQGRSAVFTVTLSPGSALIFMVCFLWLWRQAHPDSILRLSLTASLLKDGEYAQFYALPRCGIVTGQRVFYRAVRDRGVDMVEYIAA